MYHQDVDGQPNANLLRDREFTADELNQVVKKVSILLSYFTFGTQRFRKYISMRRLIT